MTAVEWLEEEMLKPNLSMKDILEQAKEMEKQQIIDAWIAVDNPLQRLTAEEYYKQKFNK